MPVARSAVVALAVAVAVRAGAATCPPDGFDAILCALTDVQGDGCAPRALARLATRSAKAVAAAQAADAKGRARRAHASLQRARDVLFTLEIRGQRLVARGRLDAGCYAGMAVTIEGALAGLAALQFGTTTTTAPPGPTTTTITTTTTVPGATSTTVTTTTTSTTRPTFAGCASPTSICGNRVLEPGEQCDGSTGGRDCLSLGFTGGTLTCGADCCFDVSRCTF